MNYYWKEEEVVSKLEEYMIKATKGLEKSCKSFRCNMRDTLYIIAIDKILQAERLRGFLR